MKHVIRKIFNTGVFANCSSDLINWLVDFEMHLSNKLYWFGNLVVIQLISRLRCTRRANIVHFLRHFYKFFYVRFIVVRFCYHSFLKSISSISYRNISYTKIILKLYNSREWVGGKQMYWFLQEIENRWDMT